jgi:hypothetical protein
VDPQGGLLAGRGASAVYRLSDGEGLIDSDPADPTPAPPANAAFRRRRLASA